MKNGITLTFITLLFISCASSIEEDQFDKWIRNNDAEKIFTKIYKRKNIKEAKFEEILSTYSKAIGDKNLKSVPYKDNDFKSIFTNRERKGFEYYDSDNNLHYSITYKLVAVDADSTMNFNYIDFRATDKDLPCIKIPSFAPLRCIYSPIIPKPKNNLNFYYDSLEIVGPIEMENKKFYNYDLLKYQEKDIPKAERKNSIVLNINNTYIKSHIDIITKDLSKIIELDSFDLAYIEDISTPKLRIGFSPGFEPNYLLKITEYFREKLDDQLILTPLFNQEFVPFKGDVIIGHAYDERKKVRLGR